MRSKFFVFFVITLISFNGKCDTLDYWHVTINDSLIGQFNSLNANPTINLSSEWSNFDSISIQYFSDTPCSECRSMLSVRDENKMKFRATSNTGAWVKLTLSLGELMRLAKMYNSSSMDFDYWQSGESKLNTKKLLFKAILE